MKIKRYAVKVRNYGKPIIFRVAATSKANARASIMKAERCPSCAIMSVEIQPHTP